MRADEPKYLITQAPVCKGDSPINLAPLATSPRRGARNQWPNSEECSVSIRGRQHVAAPSIVECAATVLRTSLDRAHFPRSGESTAQVQPQTAQAHQATLLASICLTAASNTSLRSDFKRRLPLKEELEEVSHLGRVVSATKCNNTHSV